MLEIWWLSTFAYNPLLFWSSVHSSDYTTGAQLSEANPINTLLCL